MSSYDHRLTKTYFLMQTFPDINAVIAWKAKELSCVHPWKYPFAPQFNDSRRAHGNIYTHNRCFARILQLINYNQIPIAQIFYATLCKCMCAEVGWSWRRHSFQQYFCHTVVDAKQ